MKLWRTPFDHNLTAEPLGHVQINKDRCKGCGFCVEYCPRDVLEMSSEMSSKGYRLAAVKDGTKCLACGFCELICPEFGIEMSVNHNAPSNNTP